jgi:hypothetical protein
VLSEEDKKEKKKEKKPAVTLTEYVDSPFQKA